MTITLVSPGDSAPAPSKPVDVNDLLSKLISAGIINKSEEKKQEKQETEKEKTEKAESKPVLDKGSKKKVRNYGHTCIYTSYRLFSLTFKH